MQQPNTIKKASKTGHTSCVSFFVHPDLSEAVKKEAKRINVPRSRLYRQAIEMYLETVL